MFWFSVRSFGPTKVDAPLNSYTGGLLVFVKIIIGRCIYIAFKRFSSVPKLAVAVAARVFIYRKTQVQNVSGHVCDTN